MSISYGGIALPTSTDELEAVLQQYVPLEQIDEFEGTYSAPNDLGHLPFVPLEPPKVRKLGQLFWPRQAAKYAYAHFIVSDRILNLIRPLAYAGNQLNALTLTIGDSKRSISTDMFLVPPRPISQLTTPAANGNLWLLTLVDDRYYWWYRNGSLTVSPGVTTWNALYAQIAMILGVTITVDTVSPDYQKPTNRFTTYQQPIPILLDQVAYSIGQRIVRRLDGTVEAQNYTTAQTDYQTNYATIVNRGFGGQMFVQDNPGVSGDMFALVPAAVRVVFPTYLNDTGVINNVYSIDNDLATLALPDYPTSVVGFPDTQVAWGDQYATFVSGGAPSPTNLSALEAYASGFSRDWYNWQTYGTDVTYSGVGAWLPEGITDTIEYSYDSSVLMSRVQRSPWNDRAGGGFDNLRTNTAVSGGTTPGNLTIRDDKGHSFSNIVDLELYNSLATSTGPGVAQWRVDDVSLTMPGIVNLLDQDMGQNDKIFNKFVLVNASGWADSGVDSFPDREAFGVYSYRDDDNPFVRFSSLDAQLEVGHLNNPASGYGDPNQLFVPIWAGYNFNRYHGIGGMEPDVTAIFGARTGVQSAGSTMWYVENESNLDWEATIVNSLITGGGGDGRRSLSIRNGSELTFTPGNVRLMLDVGYSIFSNVLRWGATSPPGSIVDYRYGVQDAAGTEWDGQSTSGLHPYSKFVGGILVQESIDTHGREELAFPYDFIDTVTENFEDTGLSVTLTSFGTYSVRADVYGVLAVNKIDVEIRWQIYDVTAATFITPLTTACVTTVSNAYTLGFSSYSFDYIYSSGPNRQLQLWAQVENPQSGTFSDAQIGGAASKATSVMTFDRVG